MKKFLSLVLAMIMTMSLVTISAGATEYKDLTDKDEIKYEEAVAVLNRIGVITGYSDGSFQPETELTRGAAAKIIVSLMIGPDAAAALPNTSSPYPDVPAGHTFAGVIGFCKTKGYISGYGDGNFKPAGTLTGYAFAKMLLGALGYSSDIERFTGAGWTMNVANIGNVAGLFDRISFDGAAAVTRDEACQLALNTLKATMVTYGGTSVVNGSTGSYTIQGTQATPKTSNNRDINANIGRKDWYGGNNKGSDYLTLEFGEEHFKDLRLEHDRYDPAHDEFGRPSNEWSYKKVTIGTFPLPADFTFTTQVAHIEDTDGTKEKALGLRNYDLEADGGYSVWNGWGNDGSSWVSNGGTTTLWQNGKEIEDFFDGKKVASIADFTDNGNLVEVYVSHVDADWITDVVVIQTQLMEVDKIGSDYVSLARVEPDANNRPDHTLANGKDANIGFNLSPMHVIVEQVKDVNEDCYSIVKDLKSGDKVAVVPVTTDDGKTYEAAEVYVPETVSGALTRIDTYGIGTDVAKERGAISITVGGTEYKLANWNDKMWDLQAESIKATRKDVTLLMDKYGNAMLAKDVGETNDFMVIGNYYQALVGNKVCTFVHGWDIKGNELDLNLGSSIKVQNHGQNNDKNHVIGELVYYTSKNVSGDADYQLLHNDGTYTKAVWDVYTNTNRQNNTTLADGVADSYEIKAANVTIPLADKHAGTDKFVDGQYATGAENGLALHKNYDKYDRHSYYYDKDVKFIYVSYDGDGEVENIEFKSGAQNVSNDELRHVIQGWASQAAVKDEKVQAVVIKTDSSDASVNRMLYVTDTKGFKEVDKETNESFFEVEVAMFTADGKFLTEQHIMVNKNLQIGDFATYTKVAGTKYEDNYYRVKEFDRHNSNPAVLTTTGVAEVTTANNKTVSHLLRVNSATKIDGTKLTAFNAGTGALDTQSYMLGDYRNSGSDVFDLPGTASAVMNTVNAEWLNATGDRAYDVVDSTDDLFKLKNVDFSKVELDILLNEKPDSDGFRTAYLIVLKSMNGEADPDAGPWYSKPNTSSTLKGVSIDISFDAAKYAADSATATVKVTPVIDGVTETADSKDVTLTRKGDKMVGSVRFYNNTDLTKANIEFIKDAEVYSAVKVRYFNGDGATPVEITIPNATATLASGTSGNVVFTWKTSDAASHELTGSITGVTGAPVTYTTTDGASINRVFTKAVTPTGKDYVDVTITGIAALVENYSITIPSDISSTGVVIPGGEAAKVTINVNKASGLKGNDPVYFTVALDAPISAAGVASYDVTFKLKDAAGKVVKTLTAEKVTKTNSVDVDWNVTDSVSLTATDISVEANAPATRPTGAEDIGTNTITLSFVGNVNEVTAADVVHVATNGDETAATRVNPIGDNKLQVFFPNAVTLAAGDVIAVATDAVTEIPVTFSARTVAIDPSDRVFVFQITVSDAGVKGAEVKDSMLYSAAKTLATDSAPDEEEEESTPIEVTLTLDDAVDAWTITGENKKSANPGQSVTFTLEQANAGDLATTATVAVTLENGTATGAVTTAGVADTAAKAVITVTYTIPGEATGAQTIKITSVTTTPADPSA